MAGRAYGSGVYGAGIYPPAYRNYTKLAVMKDGSQVRNEIVAGVGYGQAVATETFVADGHTIFWPLRHEPDLTVMAATLFVAGAQVSVGNASPGSVGSDYGLLTLATGVIALVVGTGGVPPAGVLLTLTYAYRPPVLAQGHDPTSQSYGAALPTWGRIQTQASQTGSTHAQALAETLGEIALWSMPIDEVSCTFSDEADTTGITEGAAFTLTSNRLGQSWTGIVTKLEFGGSQAGAGGAHVTGMTMRNKASPT